MKNIDKYQDFAATVAMDTALSPDYLYPGLMAEVGEFMGLEAKMERDGPDYSDPSSVCWWNSHDEKLKKELGDIMWFVCMIAHHHDFRMSDILRMNKDKLKSRQKRNVISGSGDDR